MCAPVGSRAHPCQLRKVMCAPVGSLLAHPCQLRTTIVSHDVLNMSAVLGSLAHPCRLHTAIVSQDVTSLICNWWLGEQKKNNLPQWADGMRCKQCAGQLGSGTLARHDVTLPRRGVYKDRGHTLLTTDQADAESTGIFSRRANRTRVVDWQPHHHLCPTDADVAGITVVSWDVDE
eukprot:6046373-Pyramimonas_sp.AAC.1